MSTNIQATATPEQVIAAKSTIKLENDINNFIEQSSKTEKSNKILTLFIILLSIIQTITTIASYLKQ
jgi:hypothetical protein